MKRVSLCKVLSHSASEFWLSPASVFTEHISREGRSARLCFAICARQAGYSNVEVTRWRGVTLASVWRMAINAEEMFKADTAFAASVLAVCERLCIEAPRIGGEDAQAFISDRGEAARLVKESFGDKLLATHQANMTLKEALALGQDARAERMRGVIRQLEARG